MGQCPCCNDKKQVEEPKFIWDEDLWGPIQDSPTFTRSNNREKDRAPTFQTRSQTV